MKTLLIATAIGAFLTGAATAQTSTSQANSGSASQAAAQASTRSGAIAGGGSGGDAAITFNTPGQTRSNSRVNYDGDYTVRSAPQVSAPSMGSGHPCGLGGSLGFSIVGGGATGGATRVDRACMLAQMGETNAALYMYAAEDPATCRALVAAGRVSSRSYCGGGSTRPATSPRPAARPAQQVASSKGVTAVFTKCERTGGKLHVGVPRGADGTLRARAVAQCRQYLGQ